MSLNGVFATNRPAPQHHPMQPSSHASTAEAGAYQQRLPLEQLKAWEELGYGLFLHFGMSTFDGDEFSRGQQPPATFAPAQLDPEQWVRTAKEAGMRYAVLTTKHVAGFCLWPSAHTDYHVANSPAGMDVVGTFVDACHRHGIKPGLYYCSWDNHHTFGQPSLSDSLWGKVDRPFHHYELSRAYLDFQYAQIKELLERYPGLLEIWVDIPALLAPGYRRELYDLCASLQEDCLVIMNNGIRDTLSFADAWPTDVATVERKLPQANGKSPTSTRHTGWDPVYTWLDQAFYVPAEVCDTLGYEWFYADHDPVRPLDELLGMYLVARSRGANFLLNVGPTPDGLIADRHCDALRQLRKRIATVEATTSAGSTPAQAQPY